MGEAPRPFQAGEQCLLIDGRGRHYLVTLEPGREFHYHVGRVSHDDLIGSGDGSAHVSSGGARLVALRPRLADFILRMKRGAQVVYPKELGPVLVWGDVAPGQTIVEAGTGSGALAMALARAVGEGGLVVSVERRSDHAAHARKVIAGFFGDIPPQLDLRVGEVEDVVEEVRPERLVLDLPEPFAVVPAAAAGLVAGGVFCAYVPTVPQLQQTADALRSAGCFVDVEHFEVMHRSWNIEGRSVRPQHQMVGHTGFLSVARKTEPLR